MNGKLDCPLVIQMIARTWDRQFATYALQPDGPLKGARRYIYIYIHIWTHSCRCMAEIEKGSGVRFLQWLTVSKDVGSDCQKSLFFRMAIV